MARDEPYAGFCDGSPGIQKSDFYQLSDLGKHGKNHKLMDDAVDATAVLLLDHLVMDVDRRWLYCMHGCKFGGSMD